MRFFWFFILVFLLISGCLGQSTNTSITLEETASPDTAGRIAEIGDVVRIDYIMSSEDEIFDTTYEDIARSENKSILFEQPFGYEPLTFIVGSGHVNPELTEAVTGMKVGESKKLSLPIEKNFWGMRSNQLIGTMERHGQVPREEQILTSFFHEAFGVEPTEGEKIPYQYWNSTIISTNSSITAIRHDPDNGSITEVPGGMVKITYDAFSVNMEFIPKINQTFQTPDGRFITIISSNETHMVVDYNHPLAGRPIDIDIDLKEISGPIVWQNDVSTAISMSNKQKKPLFLLFTNVSCVVCRRIEFELLTHPLVLSQKDEFIWAKADVEIQKDAAKEFRADLLPLIILFDEGEEIRRINDFIPPAGMRAELETVKEGVSLFMQG